MLTSVGCAVDLSEMDAGIIHRLVMLDEFLPCRSERSAMMTIRREVFNEPIEILS